MPAGGVVLAVLAAVPWALEGPEPLPPLSSETADVVELVRPGWPDCCRDLDICVSTSGVTGGVAAVETPCCVPPVEPPLVPCAALPVPLAAADAEALAVAPTPGWLPVSLQANGHSKAHRARQRHCYRQEPAGRTGQHLRALAHTLIMPTALRPRLGVALPLAVGSGLT